ncbi:unnamed protein product [Lathyrus sativus]|nr:unnamed protein product [Lathyrus sativus]
MTATTKRGRGRPKSTVPPSPENLANVKTHEDDPSITPAVNKDGINIGKLAKATTETLTESPQVKSDERKLWVDVISDNWNPAKGLSMEYVAPKVINGVIQIDIEQEDIETELRFWDSTLILYVVGDDLSMNTVKNFMQRMWNFIKIPNLYYHDAGYFLLRFNSQEDKEAVMMRGPYTIRNMPMLLKEWQSGFNLKKDLLRRLPIWIKIPQLPLHLWGAKSLSKIGSDIGKPLVTDECTTNNLHVSYERILIEVDITQPLIDEITIRNVAGDIIMQPVQYEWRPKFCETCQNLGNKCEDRGKTQKWIPKPKPMEPTTNITPTKQPGGGETNGEDGASWTRVRKSTRDKGKNILTDTTSNINCANGFETLEVLYDHQVITNLEPC